MNFSNKLVTVLLRATLILLVGCAGGNQETTISPTETPKSTAETTTTTSETNAKTDHPTRSQGGQVVESGPYHLELVPVVESEGIHLDFYLQTGDNHEAISGTKVTGQVQLPNGEQTTLDFDYDAAGKHYYALLPEKAEGEYKIVVLTEIDGEKVNGRFSFNR